MGSNAATPPTYTDRIHVLTSLLNDLSCHHAISNIDPSDPEGQPELRSYYYLATLLTTGIHEHHCAVTAILLPGVVKCIIADSGDIKHDKPTTDLQRAVSLRIVTEGKTGLDELGSAPQVSPTVMIVSQYLTPFFQGLTQNQSLSSNMSQMSVTPCGHFIPLFEQCVTHPGPRRPTGRSSASLFDGATARSPNGCSTVKGYGKCIR